MALSKEDSEYITALEKELELTSSMPQQSPNMMPSGAMFGNAPKQNLVEWQLDFRPEMEDMEHLLRCDVIKRDDKGNEFWDRPTIFKWVKIYSLTKSNLTLHVDPNTNNILRIISNNKTITPKNRMLVTDVIKNQEHTMKMELSEEIDYSVIVFNDQGVNDILREIRMFLNKNKALSYYKFDEIKPRIRMIGHELRALIYTNYENYGIDNEYKQNNYPIMVISVLSMIEDSFRRPINGEERRDLNSSRLVTQNDNPYMQQGYPQMQGMSGTREKKGSKLWPLNWFK